jgi:hypothetical protein
MHSLSSFSFLLTFSFYSLPPVLFKFLFFIFFPSFLSIVQLRSFLLLTSSPWASPLFQRVSLWPNVRQIRTLGENSNISTEQRILVSIPVDA